MGGRPLRIGVVAAGGRIAREIAERTLAFAAEAYGEAAPEIVFHPQCFMTFGHFAGDDETRTGAFLQVANDPAFDALWFARGGHGACRIAEPVLAGLEAPAQAKTYLGYSDAGFLMAGLDRAGAGRVAHGPMPCDIARTGGEAAVRRALDWLVDGDPAAIEASVGKGGRAAAFNMIVFSQLLGTPLQPDLTGRVLMLEEVYEYMYRIDRSLFHITSNPGVRACAGIRLGRCSDIPGNDPDFERTEEEVVRYWCERSAIPYLGRADIGHDVDNKVVPFG
jgi:muramoyltetrapeptide carboxypeptidase